MFVVAFLHCLLGLTRSTLLFASFQAVCGFVRLRNLLFLPFFCHFFAIFVNLISAGKLYDFSIFLRQLKISPKILFFNENLNFGWFWIPIIRKYIYLLISLSDRNIFFIFYIHFFSIQFSHFAFWFITMSTSTWWTKGYLVRKIKKNSINLYRNSNRLPYR